jgi:hypothetical protein
VGSGSVQAVGQARLAVTGGGAGAVVAAPPPHGHDASRRLPDAGSLESLGLPLAAPSAARNAERTIDTLADVLDGDAPSTAASGSPGPLPGLLQPLPEMLPLPLLLDPTADPDPAPDPAPDLGRPSTPPSRGAVSEYRQHAAQGPLSEMLAAPPPPPQAPATDPGLNLNLDLDPGQDVEPAEAVAQARQDLQAAIRRAADADAPFGASGTADLGRLARGARHGGPPFSDLVPSGPP